MTFFLGWAKLFLFITSFSHLFFWCVLLSSKKGAFRGAKFSEIDVHLFVFILLPSLWESCYSLSCAIQRRKCLDKCSSLTLSFTFWIVIQQSYENLQMLCTSWNCLLSFLKSPKPPWPFDTLNAWEHSWPAVVYMLIWRFKTRWKIKWKHSFFCNLRIKMCVHKKMEYILLCQNSPPQEDSVLLYHWKTNREFWGRKLSLCEYKQQTMLHI